MKLANKQLSRSAQSWVRRVERRSQSKVDYHSELRDWVQFHIGSRKEQRFQEERSVPKSSEGSNVV